MAGALPARLRDPLSSNHAKADHPGARPPDRTRIEIWAAHAGETSYTKIWDTLFTGHFDGGSNSVGAPNLPGWIALILATLATWLVGQIGATGTPIVVLLAVISIWKGSVIILDFMALRHAPLLWRALILGWMALVWAVIGIAYWKALA